MKPDRAGRPIIVALMIGSLALAGLARRWAAEQRQTAAQDPDLPSNVGNTGESGAGGKLSNMDSFALGLLLGGFRGPLVMFLWTTSEAQKSAHNLEDFDTKVEWIRLLQPEFDTVHLYEIWNKAYNVSVQMTSLSNKYAAIVDALSYADSVDRQRPDDINILFDIARVFADKLGTSHEAFYYIPRVCLETQAIKPLARVTLPDSRLRDFLAAAHLAGMDQVAAPTETDEAAHTVTVTVTSSVADALRSSWKDPAVSFQAILPRRSTAEGEIWTDRLEPMLDLDGDVLPALLVPTHPRPANLPPDAPWYDGSALQFLKPYEPFPYGLSPQAIGYNYYRRSQLLEEIAHESHLQTSDFVVDSRPGLELKFWGAQEAEQGRRAELRLFGLDDSGQRLDLETRAPGADPARTASPYALAERPDPPAAPRALFEYALAARLYGDSRLEMLASIRRNPRNRTTYLSHIDDDQAFARLYQADHDFLAGALDPAAQADDWTAAAKNYALARQDFTRIILKYYVEEGAVAAVYPTDPVTGRTRTPDTIDQLTPDQRDALLAQVMAMLPDYLKGHPEEHQDDRDENMAYRGRCDARLKMISDHRGG